MIEPSKQVHSLRVDPEMARRMANELSSLPPLSHLALRTFIDDPMRAVNEMTGLGTELDGDAHAGYSLGIHTGIAIMLASGYPEFALLIKAVTAINSIMDRLDK